MISGDGAFGGIPQGKKEGVLSHDDGYFLGFYLEVWFIGKIFIYKFSKKPNYMITQEKEVPEIIIKLLARAAFRPEEVERIVTFKKGNKAKKYIDGYNACDGGRSLKNIASIIGVTSATLSPILKNWEEIGIIFKTKEGKYKKIFPIEK